MSDEPYPFESDDEVEIRELDLESVDAFAEARITVGQLVGENASWRYGHVIVDEAQDLTPMQWRMIMRRVRGRSLTIVGDLAQRSGRTALDWDELLPAELVDAQRQDLTVNYRSPIEVHELAIAVLKEFAPSVAPSRAIRAGGFAPEFRQVSSVADQIRSAADRACEQVGGQVAVISRDAAELEAAAVDAGDAAIDRTDANEDRVRYLTPNEAKGLEFDAVVLVEPAHIWSSNGGPAQLYIALTRATQRLTVLHQEPLPPVLTG